MFYCVYGLMSEIKNYYYYYYYNVYPCEVKRLIRQYRIGCLVKVCRIMGR